MPQRGNPEARLQIVVVQYLNAVLPREALVLAIPNEGERSGVTTAKMIQMGLFPGAADLAVHWRGRARGCAHGRL